MRVANLRSYFLLACLGFLMCASARAVCQPTPEPYHLPKQRLNQALQEFAHISGCFVNVNTALLDGKTANALDGNFSPSVALILLVRGSGLEVHARMGKLSVNESDQKNLAKRADILESSLKTAERNKTLSPDTAKYLLKQLKEIPRQAATLVREQGFLSPAERLDYDRLLAYIQGRIAIEPPAQH